MLQPLARDYQDRKLRITFEDGETVRVKVLLVSECYEHEECRGITYDVISSSRPDLFKEGITCWTEMKHIKAFEVIED